MKGGQPSSHHRAAPVRRRTTEDGDDAGAALVRVAGPPWARRRPGAAQARRELTGAERCDTAYSKLTTRRALRLMFFCSSRAVIVPMIVPSAIF